jgi:hypothetical protein
MKDKGYRTVALKIQTCEKLEQFKEDDHTGFDDIINGMLYYVEHTPANSKA